MWRLRLSEAERNAFGLNELLAGMLLAQARFTHERASAQSQTLRMHIHAIRWHCLKLAFSTLNEAEHLLASCGLRVQQIAALSFRRKLCRVTAETRDRNGSHQNGL